MLLVCSSCALSTVGQKELREPNQIFESCTTSFSVKNGIVTGLVKKGWSVGESTNNYVIGYANSTDLNTMLNVKIVYSYRGFRIKYHDSKNLNYKFDPVKNKKFINFNYNTWVINLKTEISKNIKINCSQ